MWQDKTVLLTGGASFIGSHLADKLLREGAIVRIADDFSSGKLENLEYRLTHADSAAWTTKRLSIHKGDLKERRFTKAMVGSADVVFHLAAAHGGRGYIHTHPADCCTNMLLDQIVFEEAFKANVQRVCFASSACVYPSFLQAKIGSNYLLKEEDADPFIRDRAFADLEYGWAKLMGEMALRAYHKQYGVKTSCVRIFTAYGPRENETHAIIALIAKVLIRMDPFVIWGSGEQDRNFTYVQDIVDGMMLAAERIEDGSAVNAGRDDRITVNQAADLLFNISGWRPKQIEHDLAKPEGVASRAADLTKAREILDWEPKVSYEEGLTKTLRWYFSSKNKRDVAANLEKLLMER